MENHTFDIYCRLKNFHSNPNSYEFLRESRIEAKNRKTRKKRRRERQEQNDLLPWILADRVPRFRSRQVRNRWSEKENRREEKTCLATLPQHRL